MGSTATFVMCFHVKAEPLKQPSNCVFRVFRVFPTFSCL